MKIYEGLDTCHTLFQRVMTWVSYDLGGFQYVGSSLVSMLASPEKGRRPIPYVSHREMKNAGKMQAVAIVCSSSATESGYQRSSAVYKPC